MQKEKSAIPAFQPGMISRHQREKLNGNRSFTIWLTGLSGAGKSTIALQIEQWLFSIGKRVYILDGDQIRSGISAGLSFSDQDRSENTRRIAEVSKLFNDAGIIVVVALISPFERDRKLAKEIISEDSFLEIFVDASLAVCKTRDTKGLYKLAEDGVIKNFTGIGSNYETPTAPLIHLDTGNATIEECMVIIKDYLIGKLLIVPGM